MTPTTLIRSFAAACAAAVFLPAQEVEQIVIQDPKPSVRATKVATGAKDLKRQLAEVISLLEDEDATSAERAKAKQKLLDIVAELTDKADVSVRSYPATGRVVLRQGDGDGQQVIEYQLQAEDHAKAKAKADAKVEAKAGSLRRRIATLDRLQAKDLEVSVEQVREAVEKDRAAKDAARADALRERAEALRARVAEAKPDAREVRGRYLRVLENAEQGQAAKGSEDVKRFAELLRTAMDRRRASTEAEHEQHAEHAEHAEAANRQFEAARRALEQARKELQRAQEQIEAAQGGRDHGPGRIKVQGLHGHDHDVLLELDTKIDRVLPKKDAKVKKENNVFFIGKDAVDVRAESDGSGMLWVQTEVQGEGDKPVRLRWVGGGAEPPKPAKGPKPAKAPKAPKQPKAPKPVEILEVEEGDAGHLRWHVVAPKSDDGDAGAARWHVAAPKDVSKGENGFLFGLRAATDETEAKGPNVFHFDTRTHAAKAGAKGEDVRVYFGDRGDVARDSDDDDLRAMIEALRQEMRELRAVLREVKAHIGAAAPSDQPFPSGLPAMPAAPPAPAALPAMGRFAPGELRRARFAPAAPAVAPVPSAPIRVAPPSAVAPVVTPPLPGAAPRAVPAPNPFGGIK